MRARRRAPLRGNAPARGGRSSSDPRKRMIPPPVDAVAREGHAIPDLTDAGAPADSRRATTAGSRRLVCPRHHRAQRRSRRDGRVVSRTRREVFIRSSAESARARTWSDSCSGTARFANSAAWSNPDLPRRCTDRFRNSMLVDPSTRAHERHWEPSRAAGTKPAGPDGRGVGGRRGDTRSRRR